MQFDISAEIPAKDGCEPIPVQIVKRHVASPAIENGVLLLDDLGFRLPDGHKDGDGVTITLRITPVRGPQ